MCRSSRILATATFLIGLAAGCNSQPKDEVDVRLPGGVVLKLKRIEPGRFTMGSPRSELEAVQEATVDEKIASKREKELRPLAKRDWAVQERLHDVEITRPFAIGIYEVTQGQYEAVMRRNPSYFAKNSPSLELLQGVDASWLPVDSVSWDDAMEFCRRLSEAENKTFDLPTEAEWEYACRAGTTTMYAFGNSLSRTQANYLGVEQTTVPVNSFEPNAFGLYNMHGNVAEWCKDWYESDYYSKSPRTDPPGPVTGQTVFDVDSKKIEQPCRVLRGGCMYNPTVFCRSAARDYARPDRRGDRDMGDLYGFRVVLRE